MDIYCYWINQYEKNFTLITREFSARSEQFIQNIVFFYLNSF